ncbi:desmethyl-deoxy-podophyllotoxin synthase-like [Mercurialis annua]|uniref:desmethyl-deoxy-podophyllotoxin synthase-like n=1 Tax=Mercurialis annua TaxID=3986 RepID=UPI0021600970|nr:desmethyl-deoxy-podophyllotoxin synthase-like [Mercurialis annua]
MELKFLSFSVLFTTLIFILTALKIWKKSKFSDLPPGPWKLPLIGNLHQLALAGSHPHRCLRDFANKFGSVMRLQLGEITMFVVSSPDSAKQVMKTHDIVFAQRPFVLSVGIITYNFTNIAFSPNSDYWRQLRKICITELLSPKRVQSFRSIREEEMSNLIAVISSSCGKPINLTRKIFSLIYGNTARISFGKKCKDQEAFISVVDEILEAASGFGVADLFPSFKILHHISGTMSKLRRIQGEADRILESIIADHRASKRATVAGDDQEDLVDVLLRLQEHGNLEFPLTTDNIKAVLQDIFVAGSETSSTTVEWAISEMLKNPRTLKKAQEEVRELCSKKANVDETDLQELDYLKLVIKETLRLHPPAPLLIPRESKEQCEINGYKIPSKSKIIINAWAIGRDPNYWPEAETFNPERFLDNNIDYKGNNFEYIPFGAGRRMCPGISFGIANVELPLAQLLYHFDWKLADGQKLESLDMAESFGTSVRRKHDLQLIPIPYHPSSV